MTNVQTRGWAAAIAVVFGVGMSACAGRAEAFERRPNIVLLVADDLGWGDVGFNGRTEWSTPRLDRLAAEGITLKRCYAAAPICAPSRGAFLTGKYPIHSGVTKNGDDLASSQTTIAEALKPAGYATAVFGKWHHGRPRAGSKEYVHPLDQGFDEFYGFTDATAAWEKFPKQLWQGRKKVPAAGYADDLFTDQALDFIDRRKEGPFFLYVAYTAPHFNIAAPADEVDKHRGRVPEPSPDQHLAATYAAMVTRLDQNVGRIVDRLEALGLSGDTLVFFASDNGATFEAGNLGTSATLDSNRPFRGQKRTLWEGGLRVPALVRWPGRVPSGVVSHEVVSLIDLLPTFVAAAAATLPEDSGVDGTSLLGSWTGGGASPPRTLLWKWADEGADQAALLLGDLKLVRIAVCGPELYNVATDPAERRDVASQHSETIESLLRNFETWQASEVR